MFEETGLYWIEYGDCKERSQNVVEGHLVVYPPSCVCKPHDVVLFMTQFDVVTFKLHKFWRLKSCGARCSRLGQVLSFPKIVSPSSAKPGSPKSEHLSKRHSFVSQKTRVPKNTWCESLGSRRINLHELVTVTLLTVSYYPTLNRGISFLNTCINKPGSVSTHVTPWCFHLAIVAY
jgi:hypothetical protein